MMSMFRVVGVGSRGWAWRVPAEGIRASQALFLVKLARVSWQSHTTLAADV